MGNENEVLENEEKQAERCRCSFCLEEKEELRRQLRAKDTTIAALVHERDCLKEEVGIVRVNYAPLC